jgi:hypothetical protein
MSVAKQAEDYVKNYFATERRTDLIRVPRGELGFDFRDRGSKLFVEVKGTAAKDLTKVLFRYFSNAEYEKARACRRNKQKYEIHLIVGVGSAAVDHYMIPGQVLLEEGRPEVIWSLPIRKSASQYRVNRQT